MFITNLSSFTTLLPFWEAQVEEFGLFGVEFWELALVVQESALEVLFRLQLEM